MTELRQDPFTRDWVIVAPERGDRPHVFRRAPLPAALLPCPLCPGHEAETPPELWRIGNVDGSWRVRVVPNKFALLARDGPARRRMSAEGLISMPGVGRHELVIESPEHTADLARAEDRAVRDVLEAYRARYRALRAEGAAAILVFRNHGPGADGGRGGAHAALRATGRTAR